MSEMKPPDGYETWIDYILRDSVPKDCALPHLHSGFDCARAELAAIRERASDLEMMLRAYCSRHPDLRTIFAPRMNGDAYSLRHPQGGGRAEDLIYLKDDGTGLPALTDDARRALRSAQKEGGK